MKITFVGAGSYGFTLKLIVDIFNFEALKDAELALMDVDQERLDDMKLILDEYFKRINYNKKVVYTKSLEEAVDGTNFVFNLVRIGFLKGSEQDMDIPKKYGLFQTVGDTSGVGGIFRGLRTMIHTMELCKAVEKVGAPGAVILNYTNPQMMLVMAANAAAKVPYIGLCHSVQGTTRQIANYIGVPYEELNYDAAGINHMNWITRLERNGEDLYPLFRSLVKERGIFEPSQDDEDDIRAKLGPVRLDMLGRVGYMVSESSHHFSEYVPFYLRTQETRDQYKIPIDRYKWNIARKQKHQEELLEGVRKGQLPEMEKSVEYGSGIVNAMVTNVPYKIYGNVMNKGLVTNLPESCAVEVACLVDKNGVTPCHYGKLPTQLASLCKMEISVHQLALEAVLKRDRRYVYWSMMADPVTHSVLTLDQMEKLADELIETHKEYFEGYFI